MFGRYSIFKWQFWRWRYRYWRRRAVKAERALEAESDRNRSREDDFATVPMRLAGLFAPPPRTGPAGQIKQVNRPPQLLPQSGDSWDTLSYADRTEFEMFWQPDAEAAGIPMKDARTKFLQELSNRRQPLNDDPYSN